MTRLNADPTLTWWQRSFIFLILLGIVAYGLSLSMEATRSQVLQSSLQAGWNVRHHKGIYDAQPRVYRGPPLMAIAAAPFGNASDGIPGSDSVPYPLTRALWFFANVFCIWLATHGMVNLLETKGSLTSPFSWWLHRLAPLILLIVPMASSLQAGYADGVLLLLIAAMIHSLVRRQVFATGLALAGAVCLHFTALVLLFIPIWRRDRLMAISVMVGLLICLVLLPGLMFGLQHTNQLNEQYLHVIKQYEQKAMVETPHGSLVSVIKEWLPANVAEREKWAVMVVLSVLGILTLMSCGFMGFSDEINPLRLLHFMGSLVAIMLLVHPQSATHSYLLLAPSYVGILAVAGNTGTSQRVKTELILTLGCVTLLISLPSHWPWLPLAGVFACWLMNVLLLSRSRSTRLSASGGQYTLPGSSHSLPNAA